MKAVLPMADDRKTGYQFLDRDELSNVYHPGVDFNSGNSGNADYGLPIVAMADGKVVFSRVYQGTGWGKLVVIEHPQIGPECFTRYAHFSAVSVGIGDEVKVGQVIGFCGKSGTGSSHCHAEAGKKKLPRYDFYPVGWSKEKVKEYWEDPYEFVERINKTNEPSEWALESIEKAKKLGITNWENPKEILNPGNTTLGHILFKLKMTESLHEQVTKEAFIHTLDKAGLLDPKK